jgi:hypothetical protein
MNGLNHWFEAKFEHLGWMALAKAYGHDLKVRAYLQSISHLKECLKDKISSVHEVDRKNDLKIMLDHTEILSKAAHKLLDSKLELSSKDKKHHADEEHDATFYCLHKWEKKMYEKLGWMVLAENEGNNLKVDAYMDTICRLKSMLMKKMGEVREKDNKDDLQILYDDTCILWRAADKLLCKSKKRSSSSSSKSNIHKNIIVHSDEAPHGMVVKIDKKGKKHLSHQSSESRRKHNKERHTRTDRDAPKKRTKKRSTKNSFSSMMGGFF